MGAWRVRHCIKNYARPRVVHVIPSSHLPAATAGAACRDIHSGRPHPLTLLYHTMPPSSTSSYNPYNCRLYLYCHEIAFTTFFPSHNLYAIAFHPWVCMCMYVSVSVRYEIINPGSGQERAQRRGKQTGPGPGPLPWLLRIVFVPAIL